MKLSSILETVDYVKVLGSTEVNVEQMTHDSRRVEAGSAFIALKGYTVDGHSYILGAIERGASAVFYQRGCFDPMANLTEAQREMTTLIELDDTEARMPDLAHRFYDAPSQKLNMIGVTGTNGKTSITIMLEAMLNKLSKQTAVIGTIENKIRSQVFPTQNTTPDALTLNAFLKDAVDAGVTDCLMEVSSHALKLNRVKHVKYDYAIFTNLTEDHLDFHPDFEDYYQSKALLFKRASKGVIINLGDAYGKRLYEEHAYSVKPLTYALSSDADVYAEHLEYRANGTTCTIVTPLGRFEGMINIPGDIYVLNTLACLATLIQMGYDLEQLKAALDAIHPVRGRLETIENPEGHTVIVDFSHTPDALKNVLMVARRFTKGRVIVVFGCGGDRDRKKRPIMGRIAYELADFVIATSDNPRTEVPSEILDDIFEGIPEPEVQTKPVERIIDRREAIHLALSECSEADTVVIAGKGHETYQIVGRVKLHFDDAEEVRKYYNH